MHHRLAARAATALAVAATVLGGCATIPLPEDSPSLLTQQAVPVTEETVQADIAGQSLVVTALRDSIDVWDTPGGSVTQTIASVDVLTVPDATPLVFLVAEQQADWYQVYLPVRPNGTMGWVRSSEVSLATTGWALDVYLADHTLVVSEFGQELARFPIAVGASDMPTPGGVYYLRELLQPPDQTDVYGVYAYGLSGFSPVLDSFRGGDAEIGLHGTNDPSTIGTDVSHGCLRMLNEDITRLVTEFQLPLGTPVSIHQ